MTAHAQVSHVVKEYYAGNALGIVGLAQQSADNNICPARLACEGRAKAIVAAAQHFKPLCQSATAEIRPTLNDDPRRLTFGV